MQPADYYDAVKQFLTIPNIEIMMQPADSLLVKKISFTDYTRLFYDYRDGYADIKPTIEIGNEMGGDWLGDDSDTINKVTSAAEIVRNGGMKTHLCLYLDSPQDVSNIEDLSMFKWASQLPIRYRETMINQVGISFYEQDSDNFLVPASMWENIFDALHALFPNSEMRMSEFGFSDSTGIHPSDIQTKCRNYWGGGEFVHRVSANFWNFSEFCERGGDYIEAMKGALK
jgi:hypothetical protein